jgi:hypothetical protein
MRYGTMSRFLVALAVLSMLGLPTAVLIAGPPAELRQEDVRLFRVKCGLCHGLNKTFEDFPGMSPQDRVAVIEDMQSKKSGWISDPERAELTALLATNDFAGLAAAVEKPTAVARPTPVGHSKHVAVQKPAVEPPPVLEPTPFAEPTPAAAPAPAAEPTRVVDPPMDEDPGETRIKIISITHGIVMAAVFFVLGIAMALSGLKRLFEKRKILPRFPGAFAWRRHVLKGKITVLCALAGLGVGLSIWALDGFSIGALPHFAIGCGVGLLFAVGGAAGLRLAAGKGTPAMRRLHALCNLTATALFAANVASGLFLVYALLG